MRKVAVAAMGLLIVMGFMPILQNTAPMAAIIENSYEFTIAESIEPPAGLVSWWPGDGNPYDYIGPNHGTLIGDTTFTPGMVGDAFSFDGYEDKVLSTGHGIDGLQELTIETWVRHDSPLVDEINHYVTLGGGKAVLRHDYGQLHFYMNLGTHYNSETSNLVIPDVGYNPFTGNPIDHNQFSFINITGLQDTGWISLSADFSNADSDFMAWPGDMDPTEYNYYNNVALNQMVSVANPEEAIIKWDQSCDRLVVGCFDYSLEPGEWTLNVNTYNLHHIHVPDVLEAYQWPINGSILWEHMMGIT